MPAKAEDLTAPLAGKRTLNRLELSAAAIGATERDKKIAVDRAAGDRRFLDVVVAANATPLPEVVLDLDATDDPIHGNHRRAASSTASPGAVAICCCTSSAGAHLLGARLPPRK